MTTSTAPTRLQSSKPLRRRAFTLVELSVSATLGAILMALVMSVVILQARLSTSVGNYADMNADSRQALTLFEREMRTARDITVMTENRVQGVLISTVTTATLLEKNPNYTPYLVTVAYHYDPATRCVYRTEGTQKPVLVLADVEGLTFRYFNKNDAPAVSTADIKKILISATLRRNALGNSNSDYIVSAMVTMRNRIVTS